MIPAMRFENGTRSNRARRRLSVMVVVALAGWSASFGHGRTARAADAESEHAARAHFRAGEVHYAAGKYADALAEYQAGYVVEPLAGFLVNIAQCQRRMGDLARARATYGKFIAVAPDSPLVPEVHVLIDELDRLISETATADRVAVPTDTTAEKSESPEILPPSAAEPASPPGPNAPGADLTARAAAAESAPTTTTPSHRRWWVWGACAAAVAAGAVTLAVVLGGSDAQTIHDGSLGTLRR